MSSVTERSSPWTLWTKYQPPEYGAERPSEGLLTLKEGVSLREECAVEGPDGRLALKWKQAVWEWEDYVSDSRDTSVVLRETTGRAADEGESASIVQTTNSRFERSYMKKQYAKLKCLERGLESRWGDDFYVTMLTLSASSRSPRESGKWSPPADHVSDLMDGWDKAYNRLNALYSDDYAYVRILEPHESGYPHIHVAVFHKDQMEVSDYEPVINSHLKNCDRAGDEAHRLVPMEEQKKRKIQSREGENPELGAVSVTKHDKSQGGAGTYVGAYLGKQLSSDAEILESEWEEKLFYSLVWATNTRRFSPSQLANTIIREQFEEECDDDDGDRDPRYEYEMAGILTNGSIDPEDDDNFISCDGSSRSSMMTVTVIRRGQTKISNTKDPPSEFTVEMRASDGSSDGSMG